MTSPPSSQQTTASPYAAYLVRIWQEGSSATLRASVQMVGERDIVRFATLDALYAYLNARAASMLAIEDQPAGAADGVETNDALI